MKWIEFEPQFNEAINNIENALNRTIKICEHFEGLVREVEGLQNFEQTLAVSAPRTIQILNQLTEVEDRENIPATVMFKAAEIFMRADYIITVLTKINALQTTHETKEAEVQRSRIPKEMLH